MTSDFLIGRGDFVLLEPIRSSPDSIVVGYRPLRRRQFADCLHEVFTDCMHPDVTGEPPFQAFQAGAGAILVPGFWGIDSTERAVGTWAAHTGTTAAGRCGWRTDPAALLFGSCGEASFATRLHVRGLSTAAQEYIVRAGFNDDVVAGGGACLDGAYFEYDRATSGDVWRCVTANNGVRTTVVSTIAPVSDTFQRLEVLVNEAGTYARFLVDDVLAATIQTNIPTGAGRHTGVGAVIQKTVGVDDRLLVTDWIRLRFWRPDLR